MVGYSYDKRYKAYKAQINIGNSKQKFIGMYPTSESAALAYDRKAREMKPSSRSHDDYNFTLEEYNEKLAAVGGIILTIADLKRLTKSSKFRGVHWDKCAGKYQARIRIKSQLTNLGNFTNEEDAARAYDNAVVEHGLDLSKLNFSLDNGRFNMADKSSNAAGLEYLTAAFIASSSSSSNASSSALSSLSSSSLSKSTPDDFMARSDCAATLTAAKMRFA